LIGGDGVDVLRGGAGNDTLLGAEGNDINLGQDGDDLLIWNDGDGSDFMEGGEDTDTIQVNGADGAPDEILVEPKGSRVQVQRTNLDLFTLDIGTTETLEVHGLGDRDILSGSTGLRGLIQLALYGDEEKDTLIGGDGDDLLFGGPDKDDLAGNDGDDVMDGGEDKDKCDGGDGTDEAIECEKTKQVP